MLPALIANSAEIPAISKSTVGGQLIVGGKPYLILGGELGNSSAGTADQADTILPRIAQLHVNTVLMPVAWEQIEPVEGSFDFSILDHWIDIARQQHLHLMVLWFSSWKNGFSSYAPAWVKAQAGNGQSMSGSRPGLGTAGSNMWASSLRGEQSQRWRMARSWR
jgi:hypothetical protein